MNSIASSFGRRILCDTVTSYAAIAESYRARRGSRIGGWRRAAGRDRVDEVALGLDLLVGHPERDPDAARR